MRRVIYTGPWPQTIDRKAEIIYQRGQGTDTPHTHARNLVVGGGFIPDTSDHRWSSSELAELYARCTPQAKREWQTAGIQVDQAA